MQKTAVDSILVAANIPEFKNQGVLWFKENESKIKSLSAKNLWWRNHVRLIEEGLKINPLALMRELSESGYSKTNRVLNPGEFSFLGSVFSVWPINLEKPVALDFDGNLVESIKALEKPSVKIKADEISELEQIYTRFKSGDYVVHIDHGIGKLKGVTPDLENYF